MEGHTTSFALEVSKNQWSIRQDWHVDYVSSAHMPSAFLKAKPCFLDSHAWINQEGEERHCFCYYRCLLWPWSNISPNQPFTKSGVWGFLLQSCLNLLSLLIIEHAGPQRGTHNHAKPQSGTFTNPSIMIKVIWKIDSFALALNFWMMESRPSSICRSTLSSSSKEPPFYKWDLIQLFYLMNLHLVHFKRNLKSLLSVLLAYCVLSQTWSENKSKRGNPRPNTISPIPFPKIPTWELNPGKSKRKSYKNPRSRVSVFR